MRDHSFSAARLVASIFFSFNVFSCGPKPDLDLFRAGGSLAGDSNAGAGAGEASSAGNTSLGGGSGGAPEAGGTAGAGPDDTSGGTSGKTGAGGAATAGGGGAGADHASAGSGGTSSAGGSSQGGGAGHISTGACGTHGPAATFFSGTQHCYVVLQELATFSDAKAHCAALGAHLVTFSNAAEDAFAWSISPSEHWIGSRDDKGDKESEVGTYTWVTAEPFDYTNWSSSQPNASMTDCGDSNGGGSCYEHCAFQWTGGEHAGQWNDRYCMHTIQAVCEWDDAGGS